MCLTCTAGRVYTSIFIEQVINISGIQLAEIHICCGMLYLVLLLGAAGVCIGFCRYI